MQTRHVQDVPCGGIPDETAMQAALMREFARTLTVHDLTSVVVAAFDAVVRAQHLRVGTYPVEWNEEEAHAPLRVGLLLGDLGYEGFAMAVDRADRLLHFKRDVGRVLEMFVLACTDVLQRFCAHEACQTSAEDLLAIHGLTTDALRAVSQAHGRKAPLLTEATWRWVLPYQRQPR